MQYLSGLELAKRDPDWTKKIALCGVLLLSAMCIPFVGQFVIGGWLAVMVQRTARGQEDGLPRLDFEMDYLMKLCGVGFRVFVVQFGYGMAMIPLVIILYACIGLGAYMGAKMESQVISLLFASVGALIMLIGMIPFVITMQCASLRAQLANDISTGFEFGAAVRMAKAMWKEQLLGGFVLMFVFFGLYIAGIIACGIGVLFTIPLAMVIMANFHAHVYREYIARGGEAVNIFHLREGDPIGSSVGPRPQAF